MTDVATRHGDVMYVAISELAGNLCDLGRMFSPERASHWFWQHVVMNQSSVKTECLTHWWCWMSRQEITKVITIHAVGGLDVCTKFHGDPSSNRLFNGSRSVPFSCAKPVQAVTACVSTTASQQGLATLLLWLTRANPSHLPPCVGVLFYCCCCCFTLKWHNAFIVKTL